MDLESLNRFQYSWKRNSAVFKQKLQPIEPRQVRGCFSRQSDDITEKIYRIDEGTTSSAMIGSSNFSQNGNVDNLEANIVTTDKSVIREADYLIDQLLQFSQEYSPGILPTRRGRTKGAKIIKDYSVPPTAPRLPVDILRRKVDFVLPIRAKGQEKSDLNLTFGLGRLQRPKAGKPYYDPRPYYEVELTLPREFWVPPLTNYVFNSKSDPVEFQAYTDNNMYFKSIFKRKTSGKYDTRPLHITGGDFMSVPREALGMFVKDKLILAGAMNYGDPITEDTLAYYGTNEIKIRMIDKKAIHLEF